MYLIHKSHEESTGARLSVTLYIYIGR